MFRFLTHRSKWPVALAGLLIFLLSQSNWLSGLVLWKKAEGTLTDQRYLFRGEALPSPNIQLVGLNSSSFKLDTLSPKEIAASPVLEKMQHPWPWDRSVYAAILDKLMQAGAKVVMFDFVFASETDGDDAFAQALEKYQGRVVIGEMFTDETGVGTQTRTLTTPNERLVPTGAQPIVGLVNIWPDADGVVRHGHYETSIEREAGLIGYPDNLKHISVLAAQKFHGVITLPPRRPPNLIDFQGPAGTYRALPVENMFVPALWKKPPFDNGLSLSNKIVIVGPMAEIFHDVHATPFGEMPGPEMQAQILAGLLSHTWLEETSRRFDFYLAMGMTLVAILICLGIPQALLKAVVLVAVTIVFLLASQIAFNHNLVLQMVPTLFCLGLTGSFGIIFEYSMEQLERRRYRNILDRYVSKNVARTILDDRRSFVEALKGRKQPVTVLFSDIRGFTTMTESTDADKLVAQLNEYFASMVENVLEYEGTLQKFIGDAIMAVWGDTHSKGEKTDAHNAVATALQMRQALKKLNADWCDKTDRAKLSIGVGVNHGEVVVGNIGHPRRMEFTVLGDGVNLAARLESATKQFHTDILVGEQVERLTRDSFIYRSVDLLTVKGKTKPVEVFGLISDRAEPSPAWLAIYHEAIKLYRARDFHGAATKFELAHHEIGGEDFLCEMYLSRCAAYQASPPPDNWNGSFTMTEK